MKLLVRKLISLAGAFLLLVAALTFLHCYRPKLERIPVPQPKPVSGAAVFYNQAFEAMPALNDAEKKLFNPSLPFDKEATQKLTAKCEKSLQLLAQGAAQPACEWGRQTAIWPGTRGSVKAIPIAQVATTLVRLHLAGGNHPKRQMT